MQFFGILARSILLLFVTIGFLSSQNIFQTRAVAQDSSSKAKKREASSEGSKDAESKEETDLPVVALVGAEIRTQSKQGSIDNGVLLIQGQKILAVGDASLEIPEGAEKIDVQGSVITPGLINADSSLWLTSSSAGASASDGSLNALDGIDAYDDQWQEVIRHGVTSVYIQPSRTGALSGFGAVVSTAPSAETVGPEVHKELAALQASLGVGARTNRTRAQQVDRIKKVLASAQAYQKKWDEYNEYLKKKKDSAGNAEEKDKKEGKTLPVGRPATGRPPSPGRQMRRGRPGPGRTPAKPADEGDEGEKQEGGSKDEKPAGKSSSEEEKKAEAKKPPEKPDVDPLKERLVRVLKGEIPIRLEINEANDFYYLEKLVKEYESLQFVFQGLNNVGSASTMLDEAGAPVVLGPWLTAEPGYADEPDSRSSWGKRFSDYDGTLVIATGGASRSSRLLRFHMGAAVASGISRERALAAVTSHAARSLGIQGTVGSLEKDKRADVVCFAGEPTDASVPVKFVLSGGRFVYRAELEDIAAVSIPSIADEAVSEMVTTAAGVAFRTQNLMTRKGDLKPGVVICNANGKIERMVFGDVELEDIKMVDLGNAVVTPGLSSAHATLGIQGLVDPGFADATYVVAADSFSSDRLGNEELMQSGVLRCLLAPGNVNPIAGQASLVGIGPGDSVIKKSASLKIVLASQARNVNRFPASLAGQVQLVRQTFDGQQLESRLFVPQTVQEKLDEMRAASVAASLKGSPTLIVAESDAEIRAALDLTEQYELKTLLATPVQLKPFVQRLSELKVTVVAKPMGVAGYNWYAEDLATASAAGVNVLFAGETAEQLRLTAAAAVEAGMDRKTALSALTLGLETVMTPDRPVWAKGAPASFVVWSSSPIGLSAKPLAVVADGQVSVLEQE